MGRKRNQGKARKAARAAKAKAEERGNNNQTTMSHGNGLEQSLAALSLSLSAQCRHGAAESLTGEDICMQFVETWKLKFIHHVMGQVLF